MNRSVEIEDSHLKPMDILILNTYLPINVVDVVSFLMKHFAIFTSLGFKLKLLFIYVEAFENLVSLTNNTNTKSFPLFSSNRTTEPELSPVVQNTLGMILLLFLTVLFRVVYFFRDQFEQLITWFFVTVFNFDDMDFVNIDSDSDDSDDDSTNYNNYRRFADDEEYEGDNEDNEGGDMLELSDYVLGFVYNDRMNISLFGSYPIYNEYPAYSDYPPNSDDDVSSDNESDSDEDDDYRYGDTEYQDNHFENYRQNHGIGGVDNNDSIL